MQKIKNLCLEVESSSMDLPTKLGKNMLFLPLFIKTTYIFKTTLKPHPLYKNKNQSKFEPIILTFS